MNKDQIKQIRKAIDDWMVQTMSEGGLIPTPVYDAIHIIDAALAEPSEAVIEWANAPARTEWGSGMMEGLLEIDSDHTLKLYAEAEVLPKVEQLIRSYQPPKGEGRNPAPPRLSAICERCAGYTGI